MKIVSVVDDVCSYESVCGVITHSSKVSFFSVTTLVG